jgi:transposase
MSHSSDLRVRVLEYIEAGGLIKTACDTFQVSRSSIQRWRSRKEETGALSPTPRKNLPYKVDDMKLRAFISSNPDAYLNEIAAHFGITDSGVWRALKRLRITRKKSRRFIKSETK